MREIESGQGRKRVDGVWNSFDVVATKVEIGEGGVVSEDIRHLFGRRNLGDGWRLVGRGNMLLSSQRQPCRNDISWPRRSFYEAVLAMIYDVYKACSYGYATTRVVSLLNE